MIKIDNKNFYVFTFIFLAVLLISLFREIFLKIKPLDPQII